MGALVAAFDLATATGGAHGEVGDSRPLLWSWLLSDAGTERPARLAHLGRFLLAYFAEFKPALVVYEKPLGIAVIANMMGKGIYATSEDTLALLRGSIGVLEAIACMNGLAPENVRGIDIKDARGHLCGQRTFAKGTAKDATMRAAGALGWAPENDNEADAAALWSLACGQLNPRYAAALGRAHLAAKDPMPAKLREKKVRKDLLL